MQLSNEGGTVRQPVGPICIRALAGLLLLFFVSAPAGPLGPSGMAEDTSTAPSVIASKLLNQIKVALQSMQEESRLYGVYGQPRPRSLVQRTRRGNDWGCVE